MSLTILLTSALSKLAPWSFVHVDKPMLVSRQPVTSLVHALKRSRTAVIQAQVYTIHHLIQGLSQDRGSMGCLPGQACAV